jgi:hypothetical protein
MYLIYSTDVRTDALQNGVSGNPNPRLNVHAKEFTMKQGELSSSRYVEYVFTA